MRVRRMIGVYRGRNSLILDGFEVVPVEVFLSALFGLLSLEGG
ncbi:MAG: hypothetical protein SFV15_25080 [Polyangiaceae bacterium]|nr:hypothetical protein [Polyangiaceae bacterium]